MELLVIRHAIAVDRSPEMPDAERPLTDDGRRRFRRVARGLRRLDLHVDLILTSPWRRATETAAMLPKLVRGRRAPEITPHLAGPPKAELLSAIASAGVARLAVVGHDPWLGELIALLTTGDVRHGELIALKKGGVALLEGEAHPTGMVLRALLPPQMIRKMP
jgi:phosphohistidine phosphatase